MCVASRRTGTRTSRGFRMDSNGPMRKAARNPEGSFEQTGGASLFKVGSKTFENRAEAESEAVSNFNASVLKPNSLPFGGVGFGRYEVRDTPAAGFAINRRTVAPAVGTVKTVQVGGRSVKVRQAAAYADIAKLSPRPAGFGFTTPNSNTTVSTVKGATRVASEAAAVKARAVSKAPDPTAPKASPITSSSPRKRQAFQIRPGASKSSTSSFGRSGVNIPN